jgi:hypothetical protein
MKRRKIFLRSPAPMLDSDEPRLDNFAPILDSDKPRLDGDEPSLDSDKPRLDGDEPSLDNDELRLDSLKSRLQRLIATLLSFKLSKKQDKTVIIAGV